MEEILVKIRHSLQELEESVPSAQQAFGDRLYQQLEALLSITTILSMRAPLPFMRGWAISPVFGVLLISEILRL